LAKALSLRLACWDYDRTRPLIDGRVRAEGIDLNVTLMRPREVFQRMLESSEFDACEMSLASHAALKSIGDNRFTGLPVALSKMFRHSCIYVRTGAGIAKPEDLRGRRVGTSRYGSTGLVFLRGMLEHEYGIASQDIDWCVGPLNDLAEKAAIPPKLPRDIPIAPAPKGRTLEDMFAAGELDALFSNYIPNLFLAGAGGISRLFPSYKAVEQDYYRRTRIFPVMHIVVLREDVYRQNPWVAASLYRAFRHAKDMALEGLYDSDALHLAFPWLLDHIEEARQTFGADYWAYGLKANRPAWDAVGQYLHEQGLAPHAVVAEELFAPEVE
jgi:4,5-dihydroxyphthalate decarboxylase